MSSLVEQRQSRRARLRRALPSTARPPASPRIEPLFTSKSSLNAAATLTNATAPEAAPAAAPARRPRLRRTPRPRRVFSLRRFVPAWLVRAVIMLALISASWLALTWVMVTQDPAQSGSRVLFLAAVFGAIFVTSLPVMHRIFSWFAPSRLVQGNPVLVAGHSFLLASFLVANLSLLLVGSWNMTMFILISALAAVVESLFLARK